MADVAVGPALEDPVWIRTVLSKYGFVPIAQADNAKPAPARASPPPHVQLGRLLP